jgi:hypothetical protein
MKKLTPGLQFNIYFQTATAALFFVFFLMLLSFNRIPPKNVTIDYKSTFPTIVDTLSDTASFRTRDWISTADYGILYLGYQEDSIFLQHNTSVPSSNVLPYKTAAKYKMYYEAKIQLEIDLSQEIKEDGGLDWDEIIVLLEDTLSSMNKYYKAYPVIIKNQEKKPIVIGRSSGDEIPLILEAKDQDGIWKAIEEKNSSSCGFGIYPIILKPQEMIVTGVNIYQGSFKTTLRLKYGDTYSKTFQGSINPTQFKDQYEEESLELNQKNNIKKAKQFGSSILVRIFASL